MPSCRARRRGRRARMTRNCLTRGEARLARVTRVVLPSVAVLSTVLRTLTLLVLVATTAGAQSLDRVGGLDRDAHEARASLHQPVCILVRMAPVSMSVSLLSASLLLVLL